MRPCPVNPPTVSQGSHDWTLLSLWVHHLRNLAGANLCTYPLGHLMLGGSFRNQGRYLSNCSGVGLTGPSVKLMQFLKQLKEAVGRRDSEQ